MFDLSPATWCDTFVSTQPVSINSFEFMFRPAAMPIASQADIRHVLRLAREYGWQFDRQRLQTFLRNPVHVILLTDAQQRIQFVSQGFSRLTGYEPDEALGKSPAFLQGNETSPETKQRIKTDLRSRNLFKGDLLNYRKNGETYWCHVEILPLHDTTNTITHYMAFEWEVAS